MYAVSHDLFEQTKKPVQSCYLRGTIDDRIQFAEAHVLKDSYSISCQSTEVTKVTIGTCYTKTLKLTLVHGLADELSDAWRGKKIKIEQGQMIEDEIEWVPMGEFFVDDPVWTVRGMNIKAYDRMMNFDVDVDFTQTSGHAYDLLLMACTRCGVELGMTQAEVEALPNGTDPLGISEDSNIIDYRDLIGYIAQALGGFAEIYRDGKLYIRNYHTAVDDTIQRNERFKNPTFSDFRSFFSEVSFISSVDEQEHIYYTGLSDGLKLELGNNPLLQHGLPETLDQQRQRITDAVAAINYSPFSVSVLTSPYYDLGDVLQFPDGIGANRTGCCMSIIYKFGRVDLKGYGENPAAQKAKSSTSKAISRAASSRDPIVYHTYVNSEAVEVDSSEWKRLAILGFRVNSSTITEVWHEIIFDLSQGTGVQLRYVYDGSVNSYNPETIFSEAGKHLLGTQMWMNATGGAVHRWEVFAKTTSGTATVDVGDVHVLLKGQGLASVEGSWDGLIECESIFEPFVPEVEFMEFEEDVELETQYPEELEAYSEFDAFEPNVEFMELEDSANAFIQIPHDNIVTEEGDQIITDEDSGDHLVT